MKSVLTLLLVALCLMIGFTVLREPFSCKRSLPAVYDARLIGTWEIDAKTTPAMANQLIFMAGGKGFRVRKDGRQPFDWSADTYTIRLQCMATDYWSYTECPYTVSATGKELTIAKGRLSGYSLWPRVLHRP